jgi:RND family efflux transporter MFP subunit
MTTARRGILVLLVLGLANWSLADDKSKEEKADKPAAEKKAPEEKKPAAPATVTVKAEPLKAEVSVTGTFEAKSVTEIILRPEAWPELSVESAVAHGARVKKGSTLIRMSTKKIDLAIEGLERTAAASQLALKQAQVALNVAEKSVPAALAAAKRTAKHVAEDKQRFDKITKSESLKDNEYNLTSARNSLSYQLEELNQLEKMYKADDLTEETEEIILTRARNRVKAYERMLHKTLLDHDRFLKYDLPRQIKGVEYQSEQAKWVLEQAQTTLPASLTERRMAFEKMQTDHKQLQLKLAQTKRDRELLTVKSPVAGTVYYGQAARGKFAEVSTVAKLLRKSGMIKPNMVIMTIVDDSQLAVRTLVAEKDLHQILRGAEATISPTAFPDSKLTGELDVLGSVPIADGKFDATIDVNGGDRPKRLRAGMNCKAAIVAYENKAALLVPKTALKKGDDAKSGYVYVMTEKGKKKRNVRIGRTKADKYEIIKGLKAGDKVIVTNPDNPKPAAATKPAAAGGSK